MDRRTDGRTDRQNILRILQDIVPLGPLPKKERIEIAKIVMDLNKCFTAA